MGGLSGLVRVLAVALALVACTKGEPPQRKDGRTLHAIVDADVRASKAMHAADDAVAKGDTKKALAVVDADARPAIDEGLKLAEAAALETPRARAKRDELASVLRDRKTELPRYVGAVESGDAERLLAAMEAQAAIERRALAAVAGIDDAKIDDKR